MKVNSSFIKDVKYNNGTLTITTETTDGLGLGRVYSHQYKYFGVPKAVYQGLITADSVGKHYHKFVKDSYRSFKVY